MPLPECWHPGHSDSSRPKGLLLLGVWGNQVRSEGSLWALRWDCVYVCVCAYLGTHTCACLSLDVCSHVLACVYRHVYIQTCGPQDVLE